MEELALDIFRSDDFRATTMTELVQDVDFVPYELDAMGIFEPMFLRTSTVTLYEQDGELHRVPTTERGTPEPTATRRGRTFRQLSGHRIAKRDTVRSHEIQDLLSPRLPKAERLLNANELVAERQQDLIDDCNYTEEFHRLGALQGIVYDADGTTVIDDWYEMYGISAPAPVTFDFTDYDTQDEAPALRAFLDAEINTPVLRALKRRRRPGTNIHALAGDEFWAKISASGSVERQLELQAMAGSMAAANSVNDSRLWQSITLAGITWHHYFGDDDQELQIEPDEAIFFPMGAKDVFKVFYFPGEDFDEANQRAKELYSVVSPDFRPNMNEWVDIYVKKYPLFACLCPQVLMKGVLA